MRAQNNRQIAFGPGTYARRFAGYDFILETSRIPADVLAHFLRYGLRDVNDYANSVNAKLKEAGSSTLTREAVAALVEDIYSGEWIAKAAASRGTSTTSSRA